MYPINMECQESQPIRIPPNCRKLQAKDEMDNLVRSLSRFSEKVLLVLSGKSEGVQVSAKKIGPAIIERLWKEMGSLPSMWSGLSY